MNFMERIQSINPDRIAWCCADYGITPDTLAAEVGLSAERLAAAMHDGAGLTFNLETVSRLKYIMPAPVTIPATSRLHYLGGMAAINLPSPAETGDWHMEQTFFLASPGRG